MTHNPKSHMAREIAEMQEAIRRLARPDAREASKTVGKTLQRLDPSTVVTVARGSSDHAATYLSYVIQSVIRVPVASIGPSIHSVYGRELKMRGLAALAISQSGGSEDTSALSRSLSAGGGHVVALTNTPSSPLAEASHQIIDIRAGPEKSIAATKSFLNSVVAGLWVISDWAGDEKLARSLQELPDHMDEADNRLQAWQETEEALCSTNGAMIIARGAALGLAGEFALKLLETCSIPAQSYSSAEVLHGPNAILKDGYPVVVLSDRNSKGTEQARQLLPMQGARLVCLPHRTATKHPLVDPLLDVQPFYSLVEKLSRGRGLDPDSPPHLRKITKTI